MAYYERMDEAVRYGPVCRRDIRLYSEQEQQIYKYVLENGFITTAETVGRKEPLPDKEADQMAWVRAANQHRLISFWWTIRITHLIL